MGQSAREYVTIEWDLNQTWNFLSTTMRHWQVAQLKVEDNCAAAVSRKHDFCGDFNGMLTAAFF